MPYPPSYLEFIRLFNERLFFEAHEVLESLWREEKGHSRHFFQGMIQIAAFFVHLENKNLSGSERLLITASAYLKPYGLQYLGVRIDKILEQTQGAMAFAVSDLPRDRPIQFFKIEIDPPV